MAEEKFRVRVVFEDRRILSMSQKKEGLGRSWIVLNRKCHRTISNISTHLLGTFDLFEACPHGISLSMEGFVLPPFESSCVLNDKDIVCVKKRKASLSEIAGAYNGENAFNRIELEPRGGIQLLANEEFQEETGGYESDSEEAEPKEMGNGLLEESLPEKKMSKKRKASSKSPSSKKKKCKKKRVAKKVKSDIKTAEIDKENNSAAKSMANSKECSQQEEQKGADDLCQISGETKKVPSRSARRKKAKRQWLREKAKLEKQELEQKQLIVTPSKKSLGIINIHVAEENHLVAEEHQQPDECSDGIGDEVVPVEVRPGHIRFKPLVGADQTFQEDETPMENFSWNGITSKKKGQKWGKEKTATAKRYAQDFCQDFSETQTAEVEKPPSVQINYEKLMPYLGSPKEGNIIAYRLIELSSSWTPEVSSFRVGKIIRYDPESKKVMLTPVPEFPIEKKMEEDDSSAQPDTSLYKEDGSLEIEFSSLLDVRKVDQSTTDDTRPDQNTTDDTRPLTAESEKLSEPEQTAPSQYLGADNGLKSPIKENGNVNPWEEISQTLNAKKTELTQSKGWNKKVNSSGGSWSYRALRSSALGPVMNYLRSQNEI
ncbi:PREDICTED: coilin isoform X2 [Tarenaya hassleriana]|uniref:coilin isoform X2 n=1 Tax=Tarenaya hassleriana TaxID=28532 RepID=UPI00053CA11A|nr:PREDICTED: coilin isoform X2 [Tarenaya hassleriana]